MACKQEWDFHCLEISNNRSGSKVRHILTGQRYPRENPRDIEGLKQGLRAHYSAVISIAGQ